MLVAEELHDSNARQRFAISAMAISCNERLQVVFGDVSSSFRALVESK